MNIPCPECKGSGFEEREEISASGSYMHESIDCRNCNGTGEIVPLLEEKDTE